MIEFITPIYLQLGKIGGLGSAIACYLEMMIVCYMGNNVKDTVTQNDF